MEGLLLKPKLQNFGHLMRRADWLEKMLGKTEGKRRKGWQRKGWMDSIIDSMDVSLSKLREMVKDREAWHAALHGVAKSRTWLSDWTTAISNLLNPSGNARSSRKTSLIPSFPLCLPLPTIWSFSQPSLGWVRLGRGVYAQICPYNLDLGGARKQLGLRVYFFSTRRNVRIEPMVVPPTQVTFSLPHP